jgi:tripartite-type tricarboxylate transporter receptor subunit TctC
MKLDYRFPLFDDILLGGLNPLLPENHASTDFKQRMEEQILEPAKDAGSYRISFLKATHPKEEFYRRKLLSETLLYCNELTDELATYKKLGTSELTWENYAPLCRVNTDAAAITVGAKWAASNGITDLPGFIDYCKAHPGEVQMGGSSNASVWHIAGGYLMSATGIDIQMITYQEGAATAVQNAAGGFIQGVTVSLAEARSFIESGDLICLGVMDEERNPVFPDVPTCKEQGYDITYYTQRGMAAPLGVDDAIMTRLEEACAAAIEDPDFVRSL